MGHPENIPAADFDTFQRRLREIRSAIGTVVVSQNAAVEQLLISSVCGGHCLLVGVPGLAKTLLVRTLASVFAWSYKRIQFTPDLMPADITGYELLLGGEASGERQLSFRPGPIFANLVLADEINRAPPKTQSALLEAMSERSVTVGGSTHELDQPFLVIATQNPIEQEGTYPLPEAQLDRFFFQINIDYPSVSEEEEIVVATTANAPVFPKPLVERADFLALQQLVRSVPVSKSVVSYCVALTTASRPVNSSAPEVTKKYIEWGAGPRASQTLLSAAKARALLQGRATPTTADVAAVALPVLRHRVIPNYHAVGEGLTAEKLVGRLIEAVKAPS